MSEANTNQYDKLTSGETYPKNERTILKELFYRWQVNGESKYVPSGIKTLGTITFSFASIATIIYLLALLPFVTLKSPSESFLGTIWGVFGLFRAYYSWEKTTEIKNLPVPTGNNQNGAPPNQFDGGIK